MLEQVQQLLHRTRDLFFRYGIKSMTMDDIASQLGMSKKTIYNHFPDKKTMLKAMMEDFLTCHHEEVLQSQQMAENAIDEMFLIARLGMQRMEKITPGFLFDLRKYHGDIWDQFEQFRASVMFAGVMTNLKRGIGEGLFRADIDMEVVARMHMQHLNLIIDPGLFADVNRPLRSLMHTIMLAFLRGIATEEGLARLNGIVNQLNETNNN
jgi:AcrR family transcriptional regulator